VDGGREVRPVGEQAVGRRQGPPGAALVVDRDDGAIGGPPALLPGAHQESRLQVGVEPEDLPRLRRRGEADAAPCGATERVARPVDDGLSLVGGRAERRVGRRIRHGDGLSRGCRRRVLGEGPLDDEAGADPEGDDEHRRHGEPAGTAAPARRVAAEWHHRRNLPAVAVALLDAGEHVAPRQVELVGHLAQGATGARQLVVHAGHRPSTAS
jgi:hypothetical protein